MVTLDDLEESEVRFGSRMDETTIHMKERVDAATIEKTATIKMPETPMPTKPISSAVTHTRVEDEEMQVLREQLEEIQDILVNNPPVAEPNYLIKVRILVAQMLEQLNRISEKDRDQVQEMKKKYKEATQEVADQTRALGWNELKFSALTLVSSLTNLIPNEVDRNILGTLGKDVMPKIGGVFSSNIQSSMKKADAMANLVLQEYSAKTSKSGSDASSKQEIIRLLDEVLQSLKSAARSG